MREVTTARERRQCVRARLTANATLRSFAQRIACSRTLDDLSVGGAHLLGVPPVPDGERVTASITLANRRRIAPRGYVQRAAGGADGFAIVFTDLSPRAEDVIHDLLARSLEDDEVPAVLVVDPVRAQRESLTRMLVQLGYRAVVVATPVEAIEQLTVHADEICAAVVGQRLTQTTGIEFAAFLRDAFPGIRRVLTNPTPASGRGRGGKGAVVQRTLTAPCHRAELARVLATASLARGAS